ncbi:MAG TPA: SMP-30/gluconolactonase/LRE family protein [Thermoleophilaceae bacterium]|nr:SMP-30/gluconolactonase/LRE family protein [Thermoleophilaceae bacterium]
MRALAVALAVAWCVLAALAPAAMGAARPLDDVRVFAHVPAPGSPEPIVVAPDRSVYVGTNQFGKGSDEDAAAPSRVFKFSPVGKLVRTYVLRGQPLGEDHGIQGLAMDGHGLLFVLDRSANPRVVVLDPRTGSQRLYARFRDVPSCTLSGQTKNCSATFTNNAAGPDYATFAPNGDLYVTDIDQALLWRVPRGGGRADVWFTDARLESVYGPNGIQVMPDGRTLLFVNTGSNPAAGDPTTGRLYKLPIRRDGRPGQLKQFWESRPADGPDGFALGRSGRIYLALAAGAGLVVISPSGQELRRIPASPVENEAQEVPFDGPASAAFLDRRVLVTNQGFPETDEAHWAVLDVFVGERGAPLFRPFVGGRRPRLRLTARPKRAVVGERTRFRFRVTLRGKPVRGAVVRFTGRRAVTGPKGRASMRFEPRRAGLRRAVAVKGRLLPGSTRVRFVSP